MEDGKYIAHPLDGSASFALSANAPVSVNLFGFKYSLFNYLEKDFNKFIHGPIGLTDELLLTDTLKRGITDEAFKIKAITTNSLWLGVTYKEDLPELKSKILKLIADGEYPRNLWS